MLRDFVYKPDAALIVEALSKFKVDAPEGERSFALIEFHVLSPDSFVWRLLIDKAVYYLYAEDYVSGLADIQDKVGSYAVRDAKLDFIAVRQQEDYHNAKPVTSAVIYQKPERSDEMMPFAATSGFDFVFLLRSSENAGHALFND